MSILCSLHSEILTVYQTQLYLATTGHVNISDNFQPCLFGNYNSFPLGNAITGAAYRTKTFCLNTMKKNTFHNLIYISFAAISMFLVYLAIVCSI